MLADALTNEDDSSFSPSLRVDVNFEDLPTSIIDELWKTKLEFDKMNARVRFPERNAKRPNGDSRSVVLQAYFASLLKVGGIGDTIWFATSGLQW